MQRMRCIHEQKALPGPEGSPLAFLPDQQKDRLPAAAGLNNNPMPAGMGLFCALCASGRTYPSSGSAGYRTGTDWGYVFPVL